MCTVHGAAIQTAIQTVPGSGHCMNPVAQLIVWHVCLVSRLWQATEYIGFSVAISRDKCVITEYPSITIYI